MNADDLRLSPLRNLEARPQTGLRAFLTNVVGFTLDLLYPPRCALCGRVDIPLCQSCQNQLAALPHIPITAEMAPLAGIAATMTHTGLLRQSVHALKYNQGTVLAEPLGIRLAQRLMELQWPVDLIVPVPLSNERLAERGFNQSQLLANELSRNIVIPCMQAALTRTRTTRSQVGLNAAQRQANVAAAFQGDPARLASKTVLVIDDVLTTGATLAACAQAALDAGAVAVYGLTLCRAE
jgi:competence protein ComFC